MKGIIVAAGYGTRFLPVTKTIPKEMLPLVNKPSIAFIVEEFINSGIKDIIIITSRRKKSMEDFLDREFELESIFYQEGAKSKLEKIKPYFNARFAFIRQHSMLGTGHALLEAKSLLGGEPAVVAYPDDLHFGKIPLTKQLIDVYNETHCSVLGTIHNPPEINRYGVLELAEDKLHVKDIVEKPPIGTEPSKEVSIGRYLYTPDFFDFLEEGWEAHSSGEYYHVYALKKQMELGRVVFKQVEGDRLDTGAPEGFIKAWLHYCKTIPEFKQILTEETKDLH
ncbi:sugar phosphate nucleotidyltransferase [Spirochaeta cellobiosiphila]|uniref:sugar phosphate nucleotidyltransferase n=1 Tax=Spirochaeta cellobiosiphila TaxID=504483 RepID=UPI0003FC1BEF|nr:UTP--glucose-1-phosphate uridylyltransferase [Spirochaeta cellobiosiphila]